jgi:hypothetical protein
MPAHEGDRGAHRSDLDLHACRMALPISDENHVAAVCLSSIIVAKLLESLMSLANFVSRGGTKLLTPAARRLPQLVDRNIDGVSP